MMRRVPLGAIGFVTACASTSPSAPRGEVSDLLQTRAGLQDAVDQDAGDDALAAAQARVSDLLAATLTEQSCVRIALLNNRGFLATLENLGVAQADLVAAGLLDNPVIGGDIVNSTLGNGLGGGLSVSQSLLSVFLIPAKRRLARAQLQHAVMEVSASALMLIRDTKIAYAHYEAAKVAQQLHRQMTQAAEVGDELAARQREAGNITQRQRELAGAQLDEARLGLLDAEVDLVEATEELNQQLGLWGDRLDWRAGELRTKRPQETLALGEVVELGVKERLDLSAARYAVEAIEYALKLRRRGLVPQVEVGLEARNEVGTDAGHEWVIGPSLAIELPIFDPGHADLARIQAQLRQAQHELAQHAVLVRSQIRLERETLVAAQRRLDYYESTVLPRHDAIYARSLEEYNAMILGAYELFEVREHQLEAEHGRALARRDYWIARAKLEYSVGGRLPGE